MIAGIVFLGINAYMRTKFVFDSGNTAGMLLLIAVVAAVFTFICGIFALPRWQGFVALAISVYAGYWLGFCRPYGLA